MVEHLNKIDIVIPCAGVGSRLGNLTKNKTKNLLEIDGKTILDYQIRYFLKYKKKINKIHFILGHKAKFLKTYILKKKYPFKLNFYVNKNYKNNSCASSIILTLKNLKHSTLFINSDLILSKKIVKNIFTNKKKNFFFARKPKNNYKSRKIKALSENGKIIKIDLIKFNYNLDVVGPFKLENSSIMFLKRYVKTINKELIAKMTCYVFLGNLTKKTKFEFEYINDNDWNEVNTLTEYKAIQKKLTFNKLSR